MAQQVIVISGKRNVSLESWGAPTGMPIFLLHGTPGSRRGPRPRTSVLYRLGVLLISYDRPGYGGSDRDPGRTVADAAQDVCAIADKLGIGSFGVVGRSGGGPHALACAALLPDRVQSAGVLMSLAPSDAKKLAWYDGMVQSNVEELSRADANATAIAAELTMMADRIRRDPESLIQKLLSELARTDRRVVDDVAIRRLLTDTYDEALREGADGWTDDVVALRRPWGFELSKIAVPVLLWHGAVTHAYWLGQQIRTSEVRVQSDAAHFGAVEILPSILAWVKGDDASRRSRVQVRNSRPSPPSYQIP